MLVMYSQNSRMYYGAEWHGYSFVNWLSREYAGSTDFIVHLAGLVENKSKNIFVIGDGDDRLDDQLSRSGDGRAIGTVIGVLP